MSTVIYGKDTITGSNDPVNLSDNKLHIAQYVWDTGSLSWIRQTGSSGTGTDVVVTNFPSTQNVAITSTPQYSLIYDEVSSSTAYLGKATVGASQGSGVWAIQKLAFVGNSVTVTWADGNSSFDNVWTNRASLSYS